jgi:small subunit ribosomal protein S15
LARVHSHRRGKSHSTRPVTKRAPSWCTYGADEVASLVIKLAREGKSASRIGDILRDQHGIPLAKSIMEKKITQIVKDAKLAPSLPEDLAALLRRANQLVRHIEKNRGDHKNTHSLQLLESRVHRLSTYYKQKGVIPADWKYKAVVGSFM